MKQLLILSVFIGFITPASAQDQLFKNDNSKLLVKITEISPDEIKYKLFSNLTGPTYVESKNEISLIIYENGQHEVIVHSPVSSPSMQSAGMRPVNRGGMTRADSLMYYKHSENVSLNFLSFVNMELGFIYQKDFFRNNFNLIIPLAIGVEKPSLTQSTFFNYYGNNGQLNLNRKLFEVGLGINYYPSLRSPINYYIGPVLRYMQYSAQQTYGYSYYSGPGSTAYYKILDKDVTLTRYCVSITNGFIIRTRSRLMFNIFGSLGFKNDVIIGGIIDPNTNIPVKVNNSGLNLYFWSGFNIGFAF
jgi:hypothetical protein